jgi:PAS domain-containing protein
MQKLSHRLKLALDTSKIGIWELNLDTSEMKWDDRMKELYGVPEGVDPSEYDYWSVGASSGRPRTGRGGVQRGD